jgi:uncharacterized protein with ACT and thioredoxin-like domain
VADLPRARLLVLAGSIMGGDIPPPPTSCGRSAPIIALNMVGSITGHVDLVVWIPSRPARWRSWPSPIPRRSTS